MGGETQASRIIRILGGTRAAARLLGEAPSTVQGWKSSGWIPADRHDRILDVAKAEGLPIAPATFFAERHGAEDSSAGASAQSRGGVAQLEARRAHNPEVAGSSPAPASGGEGALP